jgi:hypothetical protein
VGAASAMAPQPYACLGLAAPSTPDACPTSEWLLAERGRPKALGRGGSPEGGRRLHSRQLRMPGTSNWAWDVGRGAAGGGGGWGGGGR